MAVFVLARVVLSIKPFTADDAQSSAVAIVRDYLDAFIVAGLAALLLITFVVRTFYIPSISMVPTLAVRDILLVDELHYRLAKPSFGDIAIFNAPIDSGGDDFVKRVIGVPGDTIAVHDGTVYRNGQPLVEPYENQVPAYDLDVRNYGIYVNGVALDPHAANIPPKRDWSSPNHIPAGFFFMLGDNRNYSDDSHVWGFAQWDGPFASGPLAHTSARASFAGRAFMIFWPLSRVRILQ